MANPAAEESAFARSTGHSGAEVLTVSALNRSVRDLLEHRFPLAWVAGEISNFTLARSGHFYFSLKDEQAQVRCVMFRSRGAYIDWQPRDGMQVEVRALVSLYEPRGDFQLNVEFMRRAGLGALYEAFLRLRDRLEREGLFAPAAKRDPPAFPRAIGVVTSRSAAALHDVLTTLARRNPSIPVVVYPTAVQGERAPVEIATALAAAGDRREVDVLILCRGGGSIEDLWAFNDERVARAIRACPIPVVTGVGHETDLTIADFAADRRAPTPTAAAELVSPARDELRVQLDRLATRLRGCLERYLETRMQLLDHLARRVVHPGRRLEAQSALVAHLRSRLAQGAGRSLDRERWRVRALLDRTRRQRPPIETLAAHVSQLVQRTRATAAGALAARVTRIEALARSLSHLDPRAVLERGYSVVRSADGRIVRRAASIAPGDLLDVTFAAGSAQARVERKG